MVWHILGAYFCNHEGWVWSELFSISVFLYISHFCCVSLSRSWSEVKVAASQHYIDFAETKFHRKVFIESLQNRSVHRRIYHLSGTV